MKIYTVETPELGDLLCTAELNQLLTMYATQEQAEEACRMWNETMGSDDKYWQAYVVKFDVVAAGLPATIPLSEAEIRAEMAWNRSKS